MRQTLKKGFTIAVSVMTALWSVGIAAFVPLSAAAAQSEGDLVKASLPAVYYVGANEKRYVFPNEKTYKTWWSNFTAVETITDAELAAIPIGGNATYRPGAQLVKITTDPKVYMVGANAVLYAVDSEATATTLFGSDWNTKIHDVPDAFFTNYTVSSDTISAAIPAGALLPAGTVLTYESGMYIVGEDGLYELDGYFNGIAVIEVDTMEDLEMYGGTLTGDSITAGDATTPDREGVLEGGSITPGDDTTDNEAAVSVTEKGTGTFWVSTASSGAINGMGRACAMNGAMDIDEIELAAVGTQDFNNIFAYIEFEDGTHYSASGTSNESRNQTFTAKDSAVHLSDGECADFRVSASTNLNSGSVVLRLEGVMAAASGSTIIDGSAVFVNTTQLASFAFTNATPGGGSTLQTDGSLQKVFGYSLAVNNHTMYFPYLVFKASGSLVASNCEARMNGVKVSDDYSLEQGKYYAFNLPEDKRVFDEGTDTVEMWCNIDGEAGQTVTPSVQWPNPMFVAYDNVNAVAGDKQEVHMLQGAMRNLAVGAPLNLAGASITTEVVPITNVKKTGTSLDDEVTAGTTNAVIGVYKTKVRGSKANLAQITHVMAGAQAAKGMQNCQIKLGQKKDKGEINTSSVELDDYSLSNYGGQNNLVGTNVVVNANRNMEIGDWLVVVECDANTVATAYVDGDVVTHTLVLGAGNVSFDLGTTANFPGANNASSPITIRLLTALAVASDGTIRYLVNNATNVELGTYTITGPTQEGVNLTSIGVTFAAGIVGALGCSTVTLWNSAMEEITTSQSLTAAGTLTFSVTESVAKNAQWSFSPVCVQASSDLSNGDARVLPAFVANATTVANLAGTGQSSSQSFTATPGTLGAQVTALVSGTSTFNLSTNNSNRIIGPNKELLLEKFSVTASIHEPQDLDMLAFTFAFTGAASVNDISTARIAAEGFTTSTAGAAVTDICNRAVNGATITCNFSEGDARLEPGQTGTIFLYGTGAAFGNIALAGGLVTDTVQATITPATQVQLKGFESKATIVPAGGVQNGRIVTPFPADVYLVKQSIPSTLLPGQSNMDLFRFDVIVSGATLALNRLDIACVTNDTGTTCLDGSSNSFELDGTNIGGAQVWATQVASFASMTQNLTVGTHSARILSNNTNCTTGDNIQINLTRIDYSANDGTNPVADSLAPATAITEPFNAQAGNVLTGNSNLCG